MNTGMHPAEDLLLRYSDGEATPRETREVKAHLEACWQCRAAAEEIQRTIGDCVAYRKTLETVLPEAPTPWAGIYLKMDAADRELAPASLFDRFRAAFAIRILAPAAAAAAVCAVFYYQHTNAPTVSAAELLRQAVAAKSSSPAPAPKKVRVRTRTKSFVLASTRDASLEALFHAASYDSADPLSAKAYSEWRDRLPSKTDDVATVADGIRIRTVPGSGEIAEATLTLAPASLNAVEATLRFKNSEFIEMREAIEPLPPPALSAIPPVNSGRLTPSTPEPAPDTPPDATPGDELRVLAILHALGADLGEPVEVSRSGSNVFVTAAGLSPDRERQIRSALSATTATFRVDSANTASAPAAQASTVARRDSVLQLAIERQLGGRRQFERFAELTLESSDDLMTRAHALRRLARRFPSAIETTLAPQERESLAALRRDHATAFTAKSAALRRALDPVLTALGAPVTPNPASPVSPSWQAAADNAFDSARLVEKSFAAVLGGSPGETVSEADFARQARAGLASVEAAAANLSRP